MWMAVGFLAFWLAVSFLTHAIASRTTPPGYVWTLQDIAAVAVLVLGAYASAGVYRLRIVYFVYGALGACIFLPLILPDGRYFVSIWMDWDSIWTYRVRVCVFTTAMGIVCYFAAVIRQVRLEAAARAREFRCTNCGYRLCGLPQKRCPECGTPFANDIPVPPVERGG